MVDKDGSRERVVRRVPASPGQRLVWLLERFRGEQGAVNCPIVLRLRGPLEEDRLGAGLDALAARHETLRTTLQGRGRQLTQLVHQPGPVVLHRVDLGEAEDRDASLREAVQAEIRRPIDASTWPTRSTLWRLAPDDHALCINMHHGVTDGWSCGLLLRDLDLLTRAGAPRLPPVGWQYARFCEWQEHWLLGERARAERTYWQRDLAEARLPEIPLEPRPVDAHRANSSITADIGCPVVRGLQRVAREQRATFPAVMLAVYYVVLHRLTGDEDLTVASFLANRTRPELGETVGLLANMVLLRARLHDAVTCGDVVRRARETMIGAFVHQRLPYQLLPADTILRSPRRPDDVVFQMVPQPRQRHAVAGAAAEVMVVDQLGTRFECELQLYPRDGALQAVLFFNRARLDPGWAARLVTDYVSVAGQMAAGEDVPLMG